MGSALSDTGFNPLAQAPAVSFPLSTPTLLNALLACIFALATGLDVAWLLQASAGDFRPWLCLLATLVCAAWCLWQMPMTLSGRLSWDGRDWWHESALALVPQSGSILLRMDLQSALLVQLVFASGTSRWLWLCESSDPPRWLAVRRAVHANGRQHGRTAPSSPATFS